MVKQTYFEQIPVDLAKKKVREFSRKNELDYDIPLNPSAKVGTGRVTARCRWIKKELPHASPRNPR